MSRRALLWVALACLAGGLVGAGVVWVLQRRAAEAPLRVSVANPVARVGPAELPRQAFIDHLRFVLAQPDAGLSSATPEQRALAFDEVINRELFFQQALEDERPHDLLMRERLAARFVDSLARERFPEESLSGEEIKAYYDAHVDEFVEAAEMKVAQAVVQAPADLDDDLRTAAYGRLLFVYQRALPEPASLEAIVQDIARRTEGQAAGAGELRFEGGTWVSAEQGPEWLWKAARALAPGELSAPIESPIGYHLLRVEERRGGRTVPYTEAVKRARAALWRAKKQALREELIAALRARTPVELTDDALEPWDGGAAPVGATGVELDRTP